EVGTGRLLLTMEVPGLWFHSVDYSPDGKLLATTHEGVVRAHFGDGRKFIFSDRGVRLWDAETGRELRVFRGHTDRVASARFSPDGRKLVTRSWDTTPGVWDVETGQQLHTLPGDLATVMDAVFSADGRRLLTVSSGRQHHSQGTDKDDKPRDDWDPVAPEGQP